jgi:RNA polymerase sigma factor (TIGR02999 family)
MTAAPRPDVTLLSERAHAGDGLARSNLIARVYAELRRLSAGLMRREYPGHTLPPTAVGHEAVIRLRGDAAFDRAGDRTDPFAAATPAMREVLIDHARRRATARRGGGRRRIPLDAVLDYFADQGLHLVALHEVLDRRAGLHQRPSQVVTLRDLGGMTVPETDAALELSVGTVEPDRRIARARLSHELGGEGVG